MTPPAPDRDLLRAVEAGLLVLVGDNSVSEIRIPNYRNGGNVDLVLSGYFSDIKTMAREIVAVDGAAPAIYATLNAVQPALLARSPNRLSEAGEATTANDVLRRTRILIDLDPKRQSKTSSTDAQHQAALDRGKAIVAWLIDRGVPAASIALVDSGNGAHVLISVDISPADNALVKHFLKAIAAAFDDDVVQVDTGVCDLPRICKVPGTMTRKGPNTAETPHRRSRIIEAPERLTPAKTEIIELIAAAGPTEDVHRHHHDQARVAGAGPDRAEFLARWGVGSRNERTTDEGLSVVDIQCPFNSDHGWDAWVGEAPSGKLSAGCHHVPCLDTWDELRKHFEPNRAVPPRSKGPKTEPIPGAVPADDAPKVPRVRKKIVFRAELVAVTDEAEAALVDAGDSGIYTRAGKLVHFVRASGAASDADVIIPAKGTPEICFATKTWVREAIDRCAVFVKPTDDGEKKVLPPSWAAETLLERDRPKFPRLIAVIETPTMRPDGSILTEPGYDRKTQLLHVPGAAFPEIPGKPSDIDLGIALDTINDVLFDFPYRTDEDRAAHIATILSGVARYAIRGPIPMSAFRSPTPGTGKGLAASVVSLIATGREPASMAPTDSGEEWRKAILSIGVAGWPMVLIDNVAGMLKSPVLDSVLTKTEHTDRLLGVSEMKQVPMIAIWMVTGNNITFGGDLPRRILAIDMDASVEFPEDRQDFRHPELRKYVTDNRAELVAAALTILRGYHVAGRPAHGKPRKGSFEAWDDLIRGAVVWATKKDPIATSERVRSESNADAEVLGVLLKVLARVMVDTPKTAAQIIDIAEVNPEIAGAIKAGTARGQLDSKSLGYLLKKFQKRISGGLCLSQDGHDRNGAARWAVEKSGR